MIQLLYCIISNVFLYDYCKSTEIVQLTISTSLGLHREMDKLKIKMMMMMMIEYPYLKVYIVPIYHTSDNNVQFLEHWNK
jgi:hypothetical protein